MEIAQLLLLSLFAPFIIWPVEQFFPRPHIVEELAKALILLPFVGSEFSKKKKLALALLAGVLFGFSESIFYIGNILTEGNPGTYLTRLLLTIPLHGFTYLVIAGSGAINKKLMIAGFLISVVIHYYFNLEVATF